MPIVELSDQRRLARDFKVRLGQRIVTKGRHVAGRDEAREPGESYPRETDWFVLDEAPDDVRELYRAQPKSLRIMLGFEWDAVSPTGEDLVYSLYNRAYGSSKGLKCRGTGRSIEKFGEARTNDESYALRIEKATRFAPRSEKGPGGQPYWNVRCWGRDCPLFLHKVRVPDPNNPAREIDQMAPGHDKDASCNEIAILRCFLLDPATDVKSEEHYCRVLGVMELATTSINSIIDIQSGFELLRTYTAGRSAGIPITITRKPTETYRPVKQTHYTCKIQFDHREVQRWAAIPLNEVFLSEAQRTVLKQLQQSPLGISVDSVRDLIPQRLPAGELRAAPPAVYDPATMKSHFEFVPDLAPSATDPIPSDPADSPLLVAAQLTELKVLAGGPEDVERPYDQFTNPWKPDTLVRLRSAVRAMREEMGIEKEMMLSELRLVHYDWLKDRLRTLPPEQS